MSQYTPAPSIDRLVAQPEHLIGYKPFGAEAVQHEEARIDAELRADYYADSAAYVDQFSGIPDPRYASKVRKLGRKLIGQPNGDGELGEWLNDNQHMNLELVPMHLRNWQESSLIAADNEAGNLEGSLAYARKQLSTLAPDQRQKLADYFEVNASPFLKRGFKQWRAQRFAALQSEKPDDSMPIPDVMDWLVDVPNDEQERSSTQLLNFMQWHEQRIKKLNEDPKTQERIAFERASYIDAVDRAKDKLPGLPENWRERIDAASVYIGDVFSLAMIGAGGTYRRSEHRILLQENYEKHDFWHELTHGLGKLVYPVFDEAMTDHIALALEDGNLFDFSLDAHSGISYFARRWLLHSIIDRKEQFDPALLFEAYFDPEDTGLATQEFRQQLTDAYNGVDMESFVLLEVARYLSQHEESSSSSEQVDIEGSIFRTGESVAALKKIQAGESAADIATAWSTELGIHDSEELEAFRSRVLALIENVIKSAGIAGDRKAVAAFRSKHEQTPAN